MDRIFGWIFALGLTAAVVVGTGFTHPHWLPGPVHTLLLGYKLARPLQPDDAPAAPGPGRGQGGSPGAASGGGPGGGQGGGPGGGQGGGPGGGPGGGQPPRAIAVEAAPVKVGPVKATLMAVGTLTASERVDITPEIEGRVSEIAFEEGTNVAAGAVLVRLDDQAARASVQLASADLAQAEANFSRADQLFTQKIGTDKARDDARFALERARANAQIAQVNLDKTVIRAPFAGRAGLRKVSLGTYVTRGLVLVGLQNVEELKVDFRLPEAELGAVAIGNTINVTVDAAPGRVFAGSVYAIDPQVDASGRALQLRARIGNQEGLLRPGLFARVELVTAERKEAVTVTESALVTQGRDRFVYVVRDAKAVQAKVTTGIRQGGRVEIMDGLKPGDVVVVSGQQRLRNGAAVDVVGTGPQG